MALTSGIFRSRSQKRVSAIAFAEMTFPVSSISDLNIDFSLYMKRDAAAGYGGFGRLVAHSVHDSDVISELWVFDGRRRIAFSAAASTFRRLGCRWRSVTELPRASSVAEPDHPTTGSVCDRTNFGNSIGSERYYFWIVEIGGTVSTGISIDCCCAITALEYPISFLACSPVDAEAEAVRERRPVVERE